jgi:hypothetical protein
MPDKIDKSRREEILHSVRDEERRKVTKRDERYEKPARGCPCHEVSLFRLG